MKLIQLTDIHLTNPGDTIDGRDPNANFEKALNHLLAHHADAEALIITGDLSDWGDVEDYERLKRMIADLPMTVELCIGNHDDRAKFLSVFPERAGDGGYVQQSFPLSLGTGILLDSSEPGTHAGHFCEARADWLNRTLAESEGPVWLFIHHNPVAVGVAPLDQIRLLDHERFGSVVKAHSDRIAHIFHGHCHLPLAGSFHGVPFSAPRGTNHAGWPAFDATEYLTSASLPQSYAVITATKEQTMVVMVEFGYEGHLRAEATPSHADWDRATMKR